MHSSHSVVPMVSICLSIVGILGCLAAPKILPLFTFKGGFPSFRPETKRDSMIRARSKWEGVFPAYFYAWMVKESLASLVLCFLISILALLAADRRWIAPALVLTIISVFSAWVDTWLCAIDWCSEDFTKPRSQDIELARGRSGAAERGGRLSPQAKFKYVLTCQLSILFAIFIAFFTILMSPPPTR